MFSRKTKVLASILVTLACAFVLPTVNAAESGTFSKAQICKAGIATVMGRDPGIMKVDRTQGGVIYLSYIRQDDGKKWSYKCKLDGNRIIWGSDTGRWRTHSMDSRLTYSVEGNQIKLVDRFSDGSATRKSLTSEQIGQ
ncbi:MAG: hypothetical protein IH856_25445 [Deltaproteobacteria bacterium]|nr:hypothetical protein [Deltaproteobacteria bacterium]